MASSKDAAARDGKLKEAKKIAVQCVSPTLQLKKSTPRKQKQKIAKTVLTLLLLLSWSRIRNGVS
jgi:hypothetical protein